MSAIASFYILDLKQLPELAAVPDIYQYLEEHGRESVDDFGWSGYVMLYLLTYLDEQGAQVMRSGLEEGDLSGAEVFAVVLTPAHLDHLNRVDPDGAAIAAHFEKMGYGFDLAEEAGLEALALLKSQLAALAGEEILVISVG